MLAHELVEQWYDARAAEIVAGGQPDRPVQWTVFAQAQNRGIPIREYAARVVEKALTFMGKGEATRRAHDEARAHFLFQLLQRERDCRCRHRALSRGRGKAPGFGDFDKQ